jgi:hypothetical protein
MKSDHDPRLERLFAAARKEFSGDAFIARVMSEIDRLRRRATVTWTIVGLLLVALALLLTPSLTAAVTLLTQVLPVSLIEIDNRHVAEVLAPVNSIAGIAGLTFLLLLFAIRKLFR